MRIQIDIHGDMVGIPDTGDDMETILYAIGIGDVLRILIVTAPNRPPMAGAIEETILRAGTDAVLMT